MDAEHLWELVEDQRRRLADHLDGLSDADWQRPSLCEGWTVHDVVAHVALVPHAPSLGRMLPMLVRARGSFNRLNHDIACDYAGRHTPARLVAQLREDAASRTLPAVTSVQNLAMDIVVHGQDIAIPVGRRLPVPLPAALNGLERAWGMGWPFHAATRLAGYRLVATDADWAAGEGPEVRASALSLLLLATGRSPRVLDDLGGPGVAALSAR